ncbi:hypothetical protein NL676_026991 [Syzygium grande]|nr:hypothetical protein NL676_026991 [Syzygium grande]
MGASGGKWLKSLLPHRKSPPSSDQEKVVEKGKKKWRLWRSSSEGIGVMAKVLKGSHMAASEPSDSSHALDGAALAAAMATLLRAPPKNFVVIKQEWAAIRIQTAFRAFLARRALRALRAVVRIQAIFRGRQVRKQAAITLRCMQALVRAQARVRAQSVRTSSEGQDVQNLFGEHSDQADPSKQAEQRWCASPGTLQEVRAKLQMRQEGIIKRERAMAYSIYQQQSRSSASPNSRKYKSTQSLGHSDKSSSGWSWLDRWMAAKPWENRVRRNNMTTKVCAKPPSSGQITGSSSDPISESLYGESTTSASTSASLTPVSKADDPWQAFDHSNLGGGGGEVRSSLTIATQATARLDLLAAAPSGSTPGAGRNGGGEGSLIGPTWVAERPNKQNDPDNPEKLKTSVMFLSAWGFEV